MQYRALLQLVSVLFIDVLWSLQGLKLLNVYKLKGKTVQEEYEELPYPPLSKVYVCGSLIQT